MLLLLAQAPIIFDTSSALSWGVVVVIVGIAIRGAVLLTRIDEKLRSAIEQLALLAPIPGEVALLKGRLDRAEGDINELWGEFRGNDTRRRT